MKKIYRLFFWSCLTFCLIFLISTAYIVIAHGPKKFELLKMQFDEFTNWQINKVIFRIEKYFPPKEDLESLHEFLLFRKSELGQARINDEVRKVLFTEPGKAIKKTVMIKPGTILEVGYGIAPDLSEEKYLGDVRFSIVLEHQGKKEQLLNQEVNNGELRYIQRVKLGSNSIGKYRNEFQVKVKGNWEAVKWFDTAIDLSSYAGEKVTISFITENLSSGSPWAVWSSPQIYQKDKINTDYNVLIVSLDTLRADHLNCYQYKKRITSPNMDKIAKEGILFNNFYSTAPATLSSQMSILTGFYPTYHGITYRNWAESPLRLATLGLIPKETLTTTLADQGYYCAAYTGGCFFISTLNYSKGFHLYNNTTDYTAGSVKNVFPKAFSWLAKNSNKKFFMFLHTYEIHSPYTETYYAEKENIPPFPEYKRDRANYDSGILLTDKYIGKLVSTLKENNLWEKTILIITSDHGDDLGTRKSGSEHGHNLFNELIHVPCIFKLPNKFAQGKIIDVVASSVDLVPTIMDILGIKSKIEYSGKTLLPIIHGNEGRDRFAYSEDVVFGPDLKSLVMKNYSAKGKDGELYKFLYVDPLGKRAKERYGKSEILFDPPQKRFFNLDKDPSERSNLLNILPIDYTPYQDIITNIIKKKPATPKPRKTIKSTKESLDTLKALGYIN